MQMHPDVDAPAFESDLDNHFDNLYCSCGGDQIAPVLLEKQRKLDLSYHLMTMQRILAKVNNCSLPMVY